MATIAAIDLKGPSSRFALINHGFSENLKNNPLCCGWGFFYCLVLSSHKRCKSSRVFSHPRYYGVSGSLRVGLAVNISGLLYMVCCRHRPLWCLAFLLELMFKCFVKVSVSQIHSLCSLYFSPLAACAVASFLLSWTPYINTANLLSK